MKTLDHPDMTTTETVHAPGTDLVLYSAPAPETRPRQPVSDYWTAALKFRATGRTSRALRVMAADDEMTKGLALLSGVTQDEERAQVTGIADAIDVLEAHGLTPEDCYNLAGLDKLFGRPFAEFDPDANWGPVPAQRTAPALEVTS